MKKRVIATIVVAVIALSGITAAFAASGKQGYISPKAILPGAITSEHIKDGDIKAEDIGSGEVGTDEIAANAVTCVEILTGTVNSANIMNEIIDDEDLGDAAIPSVVLNNTTAKTGLGKTWQEDFNTTISTERKMAFIFTYAANLTNTTSGNALLAKACVVGQENPTAQTYIAEPSPVRVADDTTKKIQRTVTFTNSSVSPGAYFVNVSVRTTAGDGTYTNITDRVFTVIALPTG